jgi:antitoxin component YwqK of YwqJK toxin-antitoxin module
MKHITLATGTLALLLGISLFSACSSSKSDKSDATSGENNLRGELKTVRTYKNGKLSSIVHFRDSIAEGEARNFYSNGKLASVFYYKHGKLHGRAVKYYPGGNVYRIRRYVNGKLQDTVKKYYESGKLMSTQLYKDGMPSTDLKEYTPSGKRISNYPTLVFTLKNSADFYKRKLLEFKLSNGSNIVRYYDGPLVDGKYLDPKATPIGQRGNTGQIPLQPEDRGRKVVIIAKYITPLQNVYLIQASYTYQ